MNAWWWVLIGLIAWFGVSLAVGLILGPVLRRASQARKALDADRGETPAGREKPPQNGHSPRDGPRAALRRYGMATWPGAARLRCAR